MLGGMIKSVGLGETVQTAEIDDDAITAAKIADDAVGSEHIEDLSADLTFADSVNVVVNTSNGTKIGTATGQKIAFHNATPVAQQSHIADIANDANGTAIATAVNAILSVLEGKGFTASS
jgi:hypothetical protein